MAETLKDARRGNKRRTATMDATLQEANAGFKRGNKAVRSGATSAKTRTPKSKKVAKVVKKSTPKKSATKKAAPKRAPAKKAAPKRAAAKKTTKSGRRKWLTQPPSSI